MDGEKEKHGRKELAIEPLGPFSQRKSNDSEFNPNVTCPVSDGGTRIVGFRFCRNNTIMQCGSDRKWFDTNIGC